MNGKEKQTYPDTDMMFYGCKYSNYSAKHA